MPATNRDAVANRPEEYIPKQDAERATISQRDRSAQEQASPDNA